MAGIERLLVPGYDLASSRAAVALAAAHPELVDAAVGIHPHRAAAADAADWAALEGLTGDDHVVAVGEIGLDFFRNLSPPDVQRTAFERQLAIAGGRRLPVLVHDRDAHDAVRGALRAWGGLPDASARGVLHAFSGDARMAEELAGAGFLVSFALPLAFRSAVGPRAAARALPVDRLLVETDAPYLAPGAGTRNEPTTALRVAAELARLRDEPVEAVVVAVRGSYRSLTGR